MSLYPAQSKSSTFSSASSHWRMECRFSGRYSVHRSSYLHHPVEIRISFFPVPLNHAEVMKDIAHNAGLLLSDMDSFAELRGRKRLRQIVWDQLDIILCTGKFHFLFDGNGNSVITAGATFLSRLQPFNSLYSSIFRNVSRIVRFGSCR